MNKIKKMILSIVLILSSTIVYAADYNATLGNMPVYAESKDKGVLVDLVKEIQKESGNSINIKVLPFASSLYMVQKNRSDFHIPLIKNDIVDVDKLPFTYSSETIFHVNFVIYSLKNKKIDINNLAQYKIETDRAHVAYFPFKTNASNSISGSLSKINDGKIDAFIFADFATDPYLKESKFKNLSRELYKVFDVKMVLPKSAKAKQIDTMLSSSISNLKQSGKYQEIMGKIDLAYSDWQP